MRAFISYSSIDRPLVTRIARDLKNSGVEVWLDEWEIKVGDEIRQKIEHGISEYEFFLIFLSKNSANSTWVEKELNAAFMKEVKSKNIVILPVKLENTTIPLLISGKKYADFTVSYDMGLSQLLMVLAPEKTFRGAKYTKRVIMVHPDIGQIKYTVEELREYGLSVTISTDIHKTLENARRDPPDGLAIDIFYLQDDKLSISLWDDIWELDRSCRLIALGKFGEYNINMNDARHLRWPSGPFTIVSTDGPNIPWEDIKGLLGIHSYRK